MVSNFIKRFKFARESWGECLWFTKMQGGLKYDHYCIKRELDYERIVLKMRTIEPTDLGIWLIVIGYEIRWRWVHITYVLFGAYKTWMEEPQYDDGYSYDRRYEE